jgi:hypothetical protein
VRNGTVRSANRVHNELLVASGADVDARLRGCLEQAYALAE